MRPPQAVILSEAKDLFRRTGGSERSFAGAQDDRYYFSLLRMIFPLVVLGSSVRNSTMRGYLYGAVRFLT